MAELIGVAVLVGSGITAGVLFAVALSVVPALFAMDTGTYVHAHRLLGRNWDPTMPVVVLTTTVLDGWLAVVHGGAARGLFVTAGVLMLGVSAVSHLCNVPINRRVKSIGPDLRLPEDWRDPRPLWRRWHLLRTVLAAVVLVLNAVALTAV